MTRNKSLPIEQILILLAETPPRIAALTGDLQPDQLQTDSNPDEWSANDVLAHLRSCADVWGNCIATMLAQDTPTIRAIDPRTWIKRTDYLEQEFRSSLQAFTKQRTDLLAVLKPLALESWSRTAIPTGAGAPITRTVQSFAQRLVIHERPHIKQIRRIADTIRH